MFVCECVCVCVCCCYASPDVGGESLQESVGRSPPTPDSRLFLFYPLPDSDEIVLSADPLLAALPSTEPLNADLEMDGEDDLVAASLGQFRTEFYDQDLLTCGVCRRVFALSDILKFIRHKVKTCSAKKPGCSDRVLDGDGRASEEEEEEEVIDEDSSTPSPSPGSDPLSPARVKSQTLGIINSSQRHKFKLIPAKQQQQQQQSYPHHRSLILGNQSPFNHQTHKSSPARNHRLEKKIVTPPNSGQSSLSHPFHHATALIART